MKGFVLVVIVMVALLTGCNVREPVFERLYPDTSNLEKVRERRAAEIKAAEENTEFGHLLNSTTAPREILLTVREIELDPKFNTNVFKVSEHRAFALQYCWRATYEECGHVKPINLHNNNRNLAVRDVFVMTPITVNKESSIEMTVLPDEGITPSPERLEVYVLEKNGELTPYPSTNILENLYSFTLPNDINTYFFVIKGIYEKHIGGVAYHMLKINLR